MESSEKAVTIIMVSFMGFITSLFALAFITSCTEKVYAPSVIECEKDQPHDQVP